MSFGVSQLICGRAVIGAHLEMLSNRLDNYLPSLSVELYDWIRNPFNELSSNSLNMFRVQEEEELTELQSDRSLKLKFNEVSLDMFWLSIKAEFHFVVFYYNSQLRTSVNNPFPVPQTLKSNQEIVCCRSRKSFEYVCQKYDQELKNCARENKPKSHTNSKKLCYNVNIIVWTSVAFFCW